MRATLPLLEETDFPALSRDRLQTLQVNLGYRCNQQCLHCHVNASPKRKEAMDKNTVDVVLEFVRRHPGIQLLDLTGGAPELNPHFRYLVSEARKLGVRVMDRCNLTVLLEPGQEDLACFLADHQVEITASLPCYLRQNVDQQRGSGVFDASMTALQQLNELGYGDPDSSLLLNLVYNPQGPSLPPPQQNLEADYRKRLGEQYGIRFSRLYTLANMPIKRFGSTLLSRGQFAGYMTLLRGAFHAGNLQSVMCRTLLSVDWQGYVYDCDFNQMLELPLLREGKPRSHLRDLLTADLTDNPIVVKDHCYGCTAGQGSSCGGALDA